ncbi:MULTISPECIES: hypothetical protein [Salinibaculum]|uniref:hypothetical protein n=1 Tax=Salinibaculum TaxID=2732368 RepID=UPI0030CE8BD9
MVRCPNCNDELGAETFCRACGTSVEHPGDDQPHRERQTQPRQQTDHGHNQPRRQQTRPGHGRHQ